MHFRKSKTTFGNETQAVIPTANQLHWHNSGRLPRLLPKLPVQGSHLPHGAPWLDAPGSTPGAGQQLLGTRLHCRKLWKHLSHSQKERMAKILGVCVHTTAQMGIKGDSSVGDWWASAGEVWTDLNLSVPLSKSNPKCCQGFKTLPVKCFSIWHTTCSSRVGTEAIARRKKCFHWPAGEAQLMGSETLLFEDILLHALLKEPEAAFKFLWLFFKWKF